MSFLKVIEMPSSNPPVEWQNNVESAYKSATPDEKASFVLEQALILNYLTRLYGEDGLPTLINEYKKYVISWFLPELKSNFYSKNPNNIVKISYLNIEVLLGISNSKLNAEECLKVLNAQLFNIPHAVDASFYAPYVLFVERTSDITKYIESDNIDNARSFNVSSACAIPSFSMVGRSLYVNYETVFPSYQLNYKQLGKLVAENICPNSIWSYWAGYNWRGITFSGVMGVLAAQCLERDANAIPKGSIMFGFYEIYRKIVPQISRIDQSNSLALLSETQHRRCIMKFLCYLRTTWGVIFDDAELLNYFVKDSGLDDAATLHKFLASEDTREISVEMYNVFKRSCFGTFSELDMVINGRIARANHSGSLINAKKTEEGDDPDAQQEEDDPESQKKKDETAPGDSSTAGGSTNDEAVFAGPDAVNQDSTTEDATDETQSNQEGTSPDSQPDEELKNPDESSATDQMGTDTHTQQKPKIPSVPKLDDKRGIKLSLSEGETTSTVLYRKELEAYIDSLLANPPSILSTQTIAAIKKLKAHWLHLLSVKDVHDWLAAMVRLPKSITLKK